MEYTVRELQFGDLFTAMRIVKKVNIKPQLKEFGTIDIKDKKKEEVEKIQKEKGIELFMHIIENLDMAEQDILKLMSDLSGLSAEEIKQLNFNGIKEFYDKLIEANPMEDLKDFFKQAIGSIK